MTVDLEGLRALMLFMILDELKVSTQLSTLASFEMKGSPSIQKFEKRA